MSAVARRPTTVGFAEQYAVAAGRFAAAVASTDLRAPVPACPGWTAYDLVVHLGNVHAWAATIVETRRRAAEQNDEPRSGRPRAVSQWYAAKAEDLFEVLRCTVPDEPCWTFVEHEGVAEFWARRQLHETTIHQVDLDSSAGRPCDIDGGVAADGVQEVLDTMLRRMHHRGYPAALDRPLAVVATDVPDRWLLTPQPPGPPAVRRRRDAAAAAVPDRVAAPVATLYRLLWHRPVDEAGVRVSGDAGRVRGFLASRLTP